MKNEKKREMMKLIYISTTIYDIIKTVFLMKSLFFLSMMMMMIGRIIKRNCQNI